MRRRNKQLNLTDTKGLLQMLRRVILNHYENASPSERKGFITELYDIVAPLVPSSDLEGPDRTRMIRAFFRGIKRDKNNG